MAGVKLPLIVQFALTLEGAEVKTWWIDEPFLLGCANPDEECLSELHERRFRTIISLLDEEEETPGYDSGWLAAHGWAKWNIPIKDYTAPDIAQIHKLLGLLQSVPTEGGVVIHCQGGNGRTGTMAAAYWITRGDSATDAIARIRRQNCHAVETTSQMDALTAFAMDARNK